MRARSLGWLVLLALACAAPTPEEQLADWRGSAVSPERWERVRPYLEGLTPGDDLALLAGARQVHLWGRRDQAPVVVMPSWITSLSGGASGGLSMFGQLVGRQGDRVLGSHVFGTVEAERIVPRHQVYCAATLVDRQVYEHLAALGTRGIGVIPRPSGPLFFRDLYVAGGRPLSFAEPVAGRAVPGPEALLSREAFESALPVLERLPEGTDLMSLLAALDAVFLTADFGESHSLRVRGFLHAGEAHTRSLETSDGIYKLRPFGWRDGEREVIERIALFENDRLLGVVVHRGLEDWNVYLEERLAARSAAPPPDVGR